MNCEYFFFPSAQFISKYNERFRPSNYRKNRETKSNFLRLLL